MISAPGRLQSRETSPLLSYVCFGHRAYHLDMSRTDSGTPLDRLVDDALLRGVPGDEDEEDEEAEDEEEGEQNDDEGEGYSE